MHVYIYDGYINEKKYDATLAQIETRITDLGLNGKIIRLGVLKNVVEAIINELKRGAKSIIAVGNDQTINKVASAMLLYSSLTQAEVDIPFGVIPIDDKKNKIALSLGIGIGEKACDALAARRIERIDVGLAQNKSSNGQIINNYFISQASLPCEGATLEISPLQDGTKSNFSIEIMEPGEINIINLPISEDLPAEALSNPQDGKLELNIKTKSPKKFLKLSSSFVNQSVFSLKKVVVSNKKYPLLLDNSLEITTPVEINILESRLNVIVGKERGF